MLAGGLAPGYSFFRCRFMGTVHQSPCCASQATAKRSEVPPRVESDRCCEHESVSLAAKTPVLPEQNGPTFASLSADVPLATLAVSPLRLATILHRIRVPIDSGPPILLQTCARLL